MKLSASLAYTTIFSMALLLIMILFLCTIFLQKEAVEGTIYNQIKGFVGSASAEKNKIIEQAMAKKNSFFNFFT